MATVVPVPVRIARVRATDKRFIVLSVERGKVKTKGAVLQVAGHSAVHGPDRVWQEDRVELYELDYTEALLQELCEEDTNAW
jgi:hypothetical protein